MNISTQSFQEKSKDIKPGRDYTLYLLYCEACKKFKRISASPPMGPGGTLGCPICAANKENGPHLEGAYGRVRVKSFNITLPEEVEV